MISRILSKCYSIYNGSRFRDCGISFSIGYPSRITGFEFINIGNKVNIGKFSWLNIKGVDVNSNSSLIIKDGVNIGRHVQINAWENVVIGKNVLIADRVYISDAEHNYDNINIPIIQQGDKFRGGVKIGEGCWIGIGAVILPGVTIGKNSVIGANSVVTRNIPDYCVAAGVPAKIIRLLK